MLLRQVTLSTLIFMLDGISGYNQVLMETKYRSETTFITPWGTYAYVRIPF
jgi:hypothetical protein